MTHAYAGEPLPDPATYAGLLVLGGAMGANDDADARGWPAVRERIRAHAADGVPALGICLGHQLARRGARRPGRRPTRTVSTVGLLDAGLDVRGRRDDPLMSAVATPRRGVQWNDDVVAELPAGAVVLARAEAARCRRPGSRRRVWGVQLHPEVDASDLGPWAEADRDVHRARSGLDSAAVARRDRRGRATSCDAPGAPLAARLRRGRGRTTR